MTESRPLTVQMLRTVRPGMEAQFESAFGVFAARSLAADPGTPSVHLVRPPRDSGSREYAIMRTFVDEESMRRFYDSPLYADWCRTVAPLVEHETPLRRLCGLETWMAPTQGQAIVPPPRWKMALATLAGVYPASMVVPPLVSPLVGNAPTPVRALVVSAILVAALTWVIMPLLSRALRKWLFR